jgi:hypothetical protein
MHGIQAVKKQVQEDLQLGICVVQRALEHPQVVRCASVPEASKMYASLYGAAHA